MRPPKSAENPLQDAVAAGNASPGRKRLLIVKLGAIGDVIMALPAAAAMHAEGYSVDWVAGETVAPILRLYSWVRVIGVDEAKLLRGSLWQRFRQMAAVWRALRGRGRYDLCATLYYDRRYRLLSLGVRAKRRLSLSFRDRDRRLLPGRHHTDEYTRILTARPDGETPTQIAPVPAPNLRSHVPWAQPGRPRVILVPAGARNLLRDDALRRWPIEHYVALAENLLAAGIEVLLAGGPDDTWASPYFAEVRRGAPKDRFADLIGASTLVETLSLFDSAAVTVTHDTGPLHMAGITSTAIVAIFGPTDPHGRLPQRENAVAIWGGEGFACRPCYDGTEYAPCAHNGCMAQVSPEMVLSQVEKLLKARAAGQSLQPQVLAPTHTGLVHIQPATRDGR